MFERQIEEDAQRHGGGAIVAARNCALSDGARQAVGGEGVPGAAEDVARNLVKQQHQRQGAVATLAPFLKFAAGGGVVGYFGASGLVQGFAMRTWQEVRRIPTPGPGFFLRSHEATPYAWVDAFNGADNDALQVIDKRTLEVVKTVRPAPGHHADHHWTPR